jgi:hypothetical protein
MSQPYRARDILDALDMALPLAAELERRNTRADQPAWRR